MAQNKNEFLWLNPNKWVVVLLIAFVCGWWMAGRVAQTHDRQEHSPIIQSGWK